MRRCRCHWRKNGIPRWSCSMRAIALRTGWSMAASWWLDVWRARLDRPADQFVPLLSDDELQRADRFAFSHHRVRWIVARGQLRRVLARYLGSTDVHLACSSFGKPFLEDCPLTFNISHSGDLALIAVSRQRSVGIDVERIHDFAEDLPRIAQ